MEKRTSSSKAKDFFKKNMYYLIMAVCLIAVAAMITVTVLMKKNPNTDVITNPPVDEPVVTDPIDDEPVVVDPNPDDDKPVVTPIVFGSPVDKANILVDYTDDTLVWYVSLKHYAVHQAIDFGGADGDKVYAAYAGVVESIDNNPLEGYIVTIKHSDKLKTRYASLNEPTVTQGQSVLKGAVIATMGNTAGNEYGLGAHLHFSVYENKELINPYTYLAVGGK